jgi:predicted nucleic acid-binding protein
MQQHNVVPLTPDVALNAAQLAVNLNLSSADAIVCATAWQHRATLYTHDADLDGLDNVIYLPRL